MTPANGNAVLRPAASDPPRDAMADEGVRRALLSLASSPELREMAVAELVSDLAKVTESVDAVAQLMTACDTRLTTTIVELREAAERLTQLAARHENAFKGDVAVQAALLARREAVNALSSEFAKLHQQIQQVLVQQPGTARAPWRATLITISVTAATTMVTMAALVTLFRH